MTTKKKPKIRKSKNPQHKKWGAAQWRKEAKYYKDQLAKEIDSNREKRAELFKEMAGAAGALAKTRRWRDTFAATAIAELIAVAILVAVLV